MTGNIKMDPDSSDRFRFFSDIILPFENMPPVLYFRGNLKINGYPHTAGIIGARRCLQEDKEIAIAIAKKVIREEAAIISGMAKGIDSYGHTAAVLEGGYTVAVPGCSPEICYPKEHLKLMEKIVETGLILSAYPPGTPPRPYFFPARNKIIAALSDTLFVIGAGRNSGTKTTVDYYQQIGKTDLRRLCTEK